MESFESDHCPVCSKPVVMHTDIEISEEMRERFGDKIYVPGEDMRQVRLTQTEEQQRHELEELLNGKSDSISVEGN